MAGRYIGQFEQFKDRLPAHFCIWNFAGRSSCLGLGYFGDLLATGKPFIEPFSSSLKDSFPRYLLFSLLVLSLDLNRLADQELHRVLVGLGPG